MLSSSRQQIQAPSYLGSEPLSITCGYAKLFQPQLLFSSNWPSTLFREYIWLYVLCSGRCIYLLPGNITYTLKLEVISLYCILVFMSIHFQLVFIFDVVQKFWGEESYFPFYTLLATKEIKNIKKTMSHCHLPRIALCMLLKFTRSSQMLFRLVYSLDLQKPRSITQHSWQQKEMSDFNFFFQFARCRIVSNCGWIFISFPTIFVVFFKK